MASEKRTLMSRWTRLCLDLGGDDRLSYKGVALAQNRVA